MSVQAWFSTDEVDIDPGSGIVLKLSVHNLSDATENYTIVPAGLTANWVSVGRSSITLFAGSQDVIDVEVAPPELPSTTAGPTVVGVRVIPNEDPDETVVAETTLGVRPFDDRRIVALQPVLRARHRADYEFMVENHGNGLASCRLRLIDPTERIDGNFDPPAVGVAPGGASLVRLKAKAKRGLFRRATRTLDFEVEAEQAGHEPASAKLALVQPPTISGAAVRWVAGVAAVVALAAAAWFGVIRPEIEDVAQQEVDEQLAGVQTALDELGAELPESPVTTVADQIGPSPDEGEPSFFRLTVNPPVSETADAAVSIPAGQLFDMTDVRVENSNNDSGRAALSVNGEEVFVWSLSNIRGSFFEPSITQIRLEPDDNLTFSVRCDIVGNPAAGSCVNAINIGGRTIEIDEI